MNVCPSCLLRIWGSNFDLASDHWFVCCNPVLEMVNLGDLGKMDIWAGLDINCTAMVEIQILELIQFSDLALCCCKAYLLLCFCILSMSGFISGVPSILTFLPYELDEIAGPSYSVVHMDPFEGLGRIKKYTVAETVAIWETTTDFEKIWEESIEMTHYSFPGSERPA
jgi:hypothetical protein